VGEGFAATVDGKINVRTVSNSENGVKVNGLLILFNFMCWQGMSDEQIDEHWTSAIKMAKDEKNKTVEIVKVKVEQVD
jgi:hypothetical protein